MGKQKIKIGWMLFLSTILLLAGSPLSWAQAVNQERCEGHEKFLKCHQEIYAKAKERQNTDKMSAQSPERLSLSQSNYEQYVSDFSEKNEHLKKIQSNARRLKEEVIAGVERFIKNYRHLPAK